MESQGHNLPLDEAECRALLRWNKVGRVGWTAEPGPTIQPVVYAVHQDQVLFRTAAGTLLSRLSEPTQVCFQVDDLDDATATGWSVLVRGRTALADPALIELLPQPWVPGSRPILIAITPLSFTGRAVSGD